MPSYCGKDFNQRLIRGLGSILTGGNIFCWNILFSRSKSSDTKVGIIINFVYLWENSNKSPSLGSNESLNTNHHIQLKTFKATFYSSSQLIIFMNDE